ncbi:MAG: hypothetical protein HUU55_16090, partial [Myxococcales bacterium]|nr:hypothetical protein [Myxococcales bacterium]
MNKRWYLFYGVLLAVVLAVYANHFDNSFHFDDWHTIEDNQMIRSLDNIPRFFTDARTFSTLPTNQGYRPLLSASLAIDYWLAGGLHPFFFHLTSFLWFITQLVMMLLLFDHLTRRIAPDESWNQSNRFVVFFAVALYALHPVSAETVNYIIQRGDILSTLTPIISLVIYQRFPRLRRFGLYLVPTILGALAKPPAVMFAPLLLVYILLFELESDLDFWRARWWKSFLRAIWQSIPAFVVCIGMAVFLRRMDSPTFTPGGDSWGLYVLTQPWVWLHYMRSFFLPTELTIDTDWKVLPGFADIRTWVGIVFVVTIFVLATLSARTKTLRPTSFGLWWFVITLVPTSVVPLSEVMNDHRMYFPFVGLVIAVPNAVRHAVLQFRPRFAPIVGAIAMVFLPGYAIGTVERNRVWHSEHTLWLDATHKSPRNARVLMNFGLTLLSEGNYETAREYFYRAFEFAPDYPSLSINLGVVEAKLGNYAIAEKHHLRSIQLGSGLAQPYYFYADFLRLTGRLPESLPYLDQAIANVPHDFLPRYMKMEILIYQKDWVAFRKLIQDSLALSASDPKTLAFVAQAEKAQKQELANAEHMVSQWQSPEAYLELSFVYYKLERYEESIVMANHAVERRPNYAEAYN